MEREASRVTSRLLTVVEVVRVVPSSCGRCISTSVGSLLGLGGLVWISSVEVVQVLFSGFRLELL